MADSIAGGTDSIDLDAVMKAIRWDPRTLDPHLAGFDVQFGEGTGPLKHWSKTDPDRGRLFLRSMLCSSADAADGQRLDLIGTAAFERVSPTFGAHWRQLVHGFRLVARHLAQSVGRPDGLGAGWSALVEAAPRRWLCLELLRSASDAKRPREHRNLLLVSSIAFASASTHARDALASKLADFVAALRDLDANVLTLARRMELGGSAHSHDEFIRVLGAVDVSQIATLPSEAEQVVLDQLRRKRGERVKLAVLDAALVEAGYEGGAQTRIGRLIEKGFPIVRPPKGDPGYRLIEG